MLDLLFAVVLEDLPQLGVLGGVHALLIPVDGFQLFLEANEGAVQIAGA